MSSPSCFSARLMWLLFRCFPVVCDRFLAPEWGWRDHNVPCHMSRLLFQWPLAPHRPTWNPGASAGQNHRADPVELEFSVGLCPSDGLAPGQECLQQPWFLVTSTFSGCAPIPAPAPPSRSAPHCLSLVHECSSIKQNTLLKASRFLQLLADVCISPALFSRRLTKGLPLAETNEFCMSHFLFFFFHNCLLQETNICGLLRAAPRD